MELLSAPYRFEHRAISGSDSQCSSVDSYSDNDSTTFALVSFSLMV